MVMDWASARRAMTSGPAYTYNVGAGHSSNDPPGQRVWEEEREDEPTVSVDYTTPQDSGTYLAENYGKDPDPIIPIEETINEKLPGNLPVIQDLGSSNLEKLLTDEERKLNMLYALQNQWERSGSTIRHDYDENYSTYPISSPFGLTGQEFDPYTGKWYDTDSTNPYGLAYHGATQYDKNGNIIGGTKMGDPGSVLLNAKAVSFGHDPIYGKAVLSGIGEELYNYDWTDGGENPYGTIPNPEEIYMYEDEEGNIKSSPILEKMGDISKDYYRAREEEWDPWTDPWDYGWGDYGRAGSLAELAKRTWFSESLSDVEKREQERADEGLGVATMANMEQMYAPDFARKANPLSDPEFSLGATEEYSPLYGDLKLWQESQTA